MEFKVGHTAVRIEFTFSAVLCILLIAFPLSAVVCILTAVLCHELGHLCCAVRFHVSPRRIDLTARGVGMAMALDCLSSKGRLWVSVAGSAVNLGLCLFSALFGLRTCMIVQGALGLLNLIPIPGLDGGDILRLILERFLSGNAAEKVCLAVGGIVLIPAAAAYFLLLLAGAISGRSLLAFAYLIVLLVDRPEGCRFRSVLIQ